MKAQLLLRTIFAVLACYSASISGFTLSFITEIIRSNGAVISRERYTTEEIPNEDYAKAIATYAQSTIANIKEQFKNAQNEKLTIRMSINNESFINGYFTQTEAIKQIDDAFAQKIADKKRMP